MFPDARSDCVNIIIVYNVTLLKNSKLKLANRELSETSSTRKKFELDTSYWVITSTGEAIWTQLVDEEICVKPICEGKIKTF